MTENYTVSIEARFIFLSLLKKKCFKTSLCDLYARDVAEIREGLQLE